MMDLIFVGIGGMFGSIARYKLGSMILKKSKSFYPISTFIINISGAVMLGVVTAIGFKNNMSLLLADGFLGAYTTFSTFMYEGFSLFNENKKANAVTYVFTTLFIGVIGFIIGFKII